MSDQTFAHDLFVNGERLKVNITPNETLLSALRYRLKLIGTKQGCDKGDCGACTVLINGQPTLSCLELACEKSADEQIHTIEGLKSADGIDPIILAFDECGALQCGFCQPGIILSAKALLEKNASPSLHEIKCAISGNLCRCTGYTKIYLAIMCASLYLTKKFASIAQAHHHLLETKAYLG